MTRRRSMLRDVWAAALACLAACAGEASAPPKPAPTAVSAPAPLDAAGWVERVRSTHVAADADVQAGQLERALARLQAAALEPVPWLVHPEHLRVVRQDLWFRVAQLELRAKRPELAFAHANHGLTFGRAGDVFTANLLIARGEALEATGHDSEAAASYYEALQINAGLLRATLGSPDAATP